MRAAAIGSSTEVRTRRVGSLGRELQMVSRMDRNVQIGMSEGEAAVLFEFLDRASSADVFATQAERIVVWRTICRLEKTIAALFDPRYLDLVADARAHIESEGA